ncbi:MAG TPA: DUF4232 domain-containing protein [Solirubrobacteraceae bacterium]|nr:DUF4232 domain-containing protein [Solirubrobacteraceae bacterium]
MLWFGAGGASSSSVPACQTSQLAVRHSETGAGLGHAGFVLKLTNRSSHPCAIGGYVGLLRLDVHRRPLPTVVRRGSGYLFSSARPRTINLAPGHSVYAGVEWIDGPVGNEPASCGTSGHDLEVTPPNQTTHLTIYAPTGACAHGTLDTTAIQLAPLGHGLVHFIA